MSDEIFRCCGVAVLAASASLLLGQFDRRADVGVRVCAVLFLLSVSLAAAEPLAAFIAESFGASVGQAAQTVTSVLGIAAAGKITADLCRELGSAGIASALETASKLAILLLTLPLLRSAVDAVGELMALSGV